jgi:hypothetical protein
MIGRHTLAIEVICTVVAMT